MSHSKDIRTYPAWMFEITQKFASGATKVGMQCQGYGAAVRTRQQYYMFRTLLEEPHLKAAASAIMIRLDKKTGYLTFEHVDASPPQFEVLATDQTMQVLPPEVTPESPVDEAPDAMERAVIDYLKGDKS